MDAFVDQPAQCQKKVRSALNLIKDDEFVRLAFQVASCVLEFFEIVRIFEIEIDCFGNAGEGPGQCRLAHLSWSKQGDSRKLADKVLKTLGGSALNHACNYGSCIHECKDNFTAARGSRSSRRYLRERCRSCVS